MIARALVLSIWVASILAFRLDNSQLASDQYSRVIVISDMHGDADALLQSLYLAYKNVTGESSVTPSDFIALFRSYVDSPGSSVHPLYSGNDVALIQMGDLVDRGKQSLQCLKIMNATQAVTGFKTITLMGNHEIVPLIGDAIYDRLVHPEDDLVRDASLFDRHQGPMWDLIISATIPMVRWGPPPTLSVPASPRSLSSTSTLFVHAGLTEEFLYRYNIVTPPARYKFPFGKACRDCILGTPLSNGSSPISVEAFNRMVLHDLNSLSLGDLSDKYLVDWSPFTTRDFGQIDIDCDSVDKLLALFDVARIVVGHLPTMAHRVRTNCDGTIILTDIAASRYIHKPAHESVPPTPGIVVLSAQSPDILTHIKASYTNITANRYKNEDIWVEGAERIHPINRWAISFEQSVTRISPRVIPPFPSRKRPRTDDSLTRSSDN